MLERQFNTCTSNCEIAFFENIGSIKPVVQLTRFERLVDLENFDIVNFYCIVDGVGSIEICPASGMNFFSTRVTDQSLVYVTLKFYGEHVKVMDIIRASTILYIQKAKIIDEKTISLALGATISFNPQTCLD